MEIIQQFRNYLCDLSSFLNFTSMSIRLVLGYLRLSRTISKCTFKIQVWVHEKVLTWSVITHLTLTISIRGKASGIWSNPKMLMVRIRCQHVQVCRIKRLGIGRRQWARTILKAYMALITSFRGKMCGEFSPSKSALETARGNCIWAM